MGTKLECAQRIILPVAAAAVLLQLWTPPAFAQSPCEDGLQEAQKSYDLGLFEDIPGQLEPCLTGKASRAMRLQVHSLLAKAYLATDEIEKARAEVITILQIDSNFEPASPPRFADLVAEVRGVEQTVVQVASVSKTKESLREAPATVALITAEEIARRGYTDLEQMLHDLPGFDISRSRGRTYSNIYQRGFRSNTTDRTLFLVDGVEQNDLWSNIAYISRQYPVSNIERLEVVYGPASTIYGANAFAGVINVITKDSSQFYGQDRRFGAEAHVLSGSWNTRSTELNLGGRSRSEGVRWSVTGRSFTSDEPPISQFEDWNFDPGDLNTVDYASILEISGKRGEEYIAQLVLDELGIDPSQESPFYIVDLDENGNATKVTPTEAGIAEARRLDRIGLAAAIDGRPPGPVRSTEDWFLSGKLELTNFVAGVQLSHVEEGGIGWSTDLAQAGNRNVAAPRSFSIYAKYFRDIGANTSLTFFSRYRKHDFGGNNAITSFRGFANGTFNILDFGDVTPEWSTLYSHQASTQLQTELTLFYEPSTALSLVSGLEIRDSSLQVDLSTSFEPNAGETGGPGIAPIIGGSNQLDQLDAGVFAQISYRAHEDVKIVAGGRLDYNRIRTTLGYGTVFNPRLALIYTPRDYVFKVIYAEAFKTPSSSEKYATVPRVNEEPNPDLENEKVKNLEAGAAWEGHGGLALELSAYQSTYSNIVALRQVRFPDCIACGFTGQFQNIGELRVRGFQAQARYRHEKLDASLSYTFTEPFNTNTEGASRLRVADIASHRLNGDLHVELRRSFSFDVRANFVGPRKAGAGTTVPTNPFRTIDSYTTTNVTLTYEGLLAFLKPLRNSRLQLGIDNLFDEFYYDPGVAEAHNVFAARLPQAGRSVFLRLSMTY